MGQKAMETVEAGLAHPPEGPAAMLAAGAGTEGEARVEGAKVGVEMAAGEKGGAAAGAEAKEEEVVVAGDSEEAGLETVEGLVGGSIFRELRA